MKKAPLESLQDTQKINTLINQYVHAIIMGAESQDLHLTRCFSQFSEGGKRHTEFVKLINDILKDTGRYLGENDLLTLSRSDHHDDQELVLEIIEIQIKLSDRIDRQFKILNELTQDFHGDEDAVNYYKFRGRDISAAVKYQVLLNKNVLPGLKSEILKTASPGLMRHLLLNDKLETEDKIKLIQAAPAEVLTQEMIHDLLASDQFSHEDKMSFFNVMPEKSLTQEVIHDLLTGDAFTSEDKIGFLKADRYLPERKKVLHDLVKSRDNTENTKKLLNSLDFRGSLGFLLNSDFKFEHKSKVFESLSDSVKDSLKKLGITAETLELLSNNKGQQELLNDPEISLKNRLMMANDYFMKSWTTAEKISLYETLSEDIRIPKKGQITGLDVIQREVFTDDVKKEDISRQLVLHQDWHDTDLISEINTLKRELMEEIGQKNRDLVRKAPLTFRFMIEKIKLFFKVDSYGGKTCEDQMEKLLQLQELSGFKQGDVTEVIKTSGCSALEGLRIDQNRSEAPEGTFAAKVSKEITGLKSSEDPTPDSPGEQEGSHFGKRN